MDLRVLPVESPVMLIPLQKIISSARQSFAAGVCTLLIGASLASAQQPPVPDPNRWEPAIQKFEEADRLNPPPKGGIVFYGASSIVRWDLEQSFPDLKGVAVNRGFGGSDMADAARYANRVVVPRAPRVVVLCPGENDIARGVTADIVGSGFRQFYDTVHAALPQTRIVAIGLKPTPVRWPQCGPDPRGEVAFAGRSTGHPNGSNNRTAPVLQPCWRRADICP